MATADVRPTQSQGKKRKKKDKDKTPVMEGQTEEERRILRQEQRTLQDRIGDRQQELTKDAEAFEEERAANNQLFKKVRFNREMVNDGDIMVGLAEVAIKRAGALAKSVRQYGAADIATALREYYAEGAGCDERDGVFDWASLGRDGAGLFRAPPEIAVLCGPLEKPVKERKKVERQKRQRSDDDDKATQYETRGGEEAAGDDGEVDEATNLRLQRLNDVMGDRMRRAGVARGAADNRDGAGLDLMALCVNPSSFCESVENLFDLSFLVKDAKATVELDPSTGLPTCRLAEPPEEALKKTQNVVVLSMEDCKQIGELWGISDPPLRRERDGNTPAPPSDDDAE